MMPLKYFDVSFISVWAVLNKSFRSSTVMKKEFEREKGRKGEGKLVYFSTFQLLNFQRFSVKLERAIGGCLGTQRR